MCYCVLLSTTCPDDLGRLPGGLCRFIRPDPDYAQASLGLLAYPHRWELLGHDGDCGCHLRHLWAGSEPEFHPPVEWFPEETEDIESTRAVYDLLTRLLAAGHRVDLVDAWMDAGTEGIETMELSLGAVPREDFRFFENWRFDLRP